MSTKTLKELIAGATPGPWMHLRDDRIVYTKLNDGCRGSPVVTAEYQYLPHAQDNLALIARCNPQTMTVVLEALEFHAEAGCAYSALALVLLNGNQPKSP